EVELPVPVDVRDREPSDRSVLALRHEREVEHTDDPEVRQPHDLVESLARRPLDDEVVDRPQLDLVLTHCTPPGLGQARLDDARGTASPHHTKGTTSSG